jgi:hypothetical protein
VTYVHVYGSTAKVVYVGYTPGYLGTVVNSDGVVVYGTGYTYPTWTGSAWYPSPATYGVMAQPVYNPAVGMTYGFAMGVATAAAAYAWGGSGYYHPGYYGYPCCGSASANVYGQWGNTAYSGTRTWYNNEGGSFGTTAGGSYANYATGTSGTFSANRSYNPYTGQATQGYGRTFTTPGGTSGYVDRGETYDAQTGTRTTGSEFSATGPGGRTVSGGGSTSSNVYGQGQGEFEKTTTNPNTGISRTTQTTAGTGQAPSRQTTYTDSKTGQSYTTGEGRGGNNLYADRSGNVYQHSGSGWQQHASSGWGSASGDTSWANREEQARSQADSRFNSFRQSGGGGGSGWGSRFGGGGGGWGSRFGGGGGGWGHFGGGGGGRFGGFRR